MKEKWLKWAGLEGVVRVASNILQKTVQDLLRESGSVLYLTALIGLAQSVLGFMVAKSTKEKLWMSWRGNVGSVLFGALALLAIVCTFLVFANDGPLSGHVFVVSLSIIPGAVVDRLFFGYRFRSSQILGIGIAVLAGYCVLLPSVSKMGGLPAWLGFSVLTATLMTLNQGISQAIQVYTTPMAKNVWGGLTIFLGASTLFVVSGSDMGSVIAYKRLTAASLEIGVLSVFLWTFNLWAYQGGAYIALKKLVVNGTLIVTGMLVGVLGFGEQVTPVQMVGFALYVLAFVLVDREIWTFLLAR